MADRFPEQTPETIGQFQVVPKRRQPRRRQGRPEPAC